MSEISRDKTPKQDPQDSPKGKKRDRSASERSLLRAAEEVFSKHGFKGATTRMIAKKAGVNESLIGRYFDGKMGLLIAIVERYIVEEDLGAKLNYPPQASLVEELRRYAQFKFEKDCKKNFDFFKIVLSQAIVDTKFNKWIRETIPMFQQPQLKERLLQLQEQGKIRADADLELIIKDVSIFMFGNIIGQRLLAGRPQEEAFKTLEDFIQTYAQALIS